MAMSHLAFIVTSAFELCFMLPDELKTRLISCQYKIVVRPVQDCSKTSTIL